MRASARTPRRYPGDETRSSPIVSRPAGRLTPRPRPGAHPSLAALAEHRPDGAPVLRALDALFAECLRVGASRLHVEIDSYGVRARLRRDGTLDSRRLELGDARLALGALDAALAACLGAEAPSRTDRSPCGDARYAFFCAVGHENVPARVSVERIDGPDRTSAVFELAPWPSHAPTLDELFDDARALAALRETLAASAGLIVAIGTDPVALAAFSDAVAQRCAAPDRKVVQAREAVHRPLAGTVQLECGADAHGCGRALLAHDADVVVVDESPSRASLAAVTERATGRALVVRTLACGSTADALRALAAEGTGPGWLAHRLRAVVRLDRLRTLCAHCRRPVPSDALESIGDASSGLLTPLSRALAGSLQRFCEAPGCERCEGTGVERAAHVAEVLGVDGGVASALADGAIADAAAALDAARTLPVRARELARRGKVSIEEAHRLDAG